MHLNEDLDDPGFEMGAGKRTYVLKCFFFGPGFMIAAKRHTLTDIHIKIKSIDGECQATHHRSVLQNRIKSTREVFSLLVRGVPGHSR
jgi:hypothetical protein